MEKINFEDLPSTKTPYNAQTFNTLQNNIESAINEISKSIKNELFPVGSIYTSVNNTNPSSFLGGTWVAFGQGRTLVGVDTSQSEFNTVQKTGGAKTVTLTTSQIPSHTHSLETEFDDSEIVVMRPGPGNDGNNVNVSEGATSSMSYRRAQILSKNTKSSGSGQAHNNMPPFVTVYFWRRVS